MSMFICHECGAYADADEGCGESEDGKHCVCLDCVCEWCGEKPWKFKIEIGARLCQSCGDAWVKRDEVDDEDVR